MDTNDTFNTERTGTLYYRIFTSFFEENKHLPYNEVMLLHRKAGAGVTEAEQRISDLRAEGKEPSKSVYIYRYIQRAQRKATSELLKNAYVETKHYHTVNKIKEVEALLNRCATQLGLSNSTESSDLCHDIAEYFTQSS